MTLIRPAILAAVIAICFARRAGAATPSRIRIAPDHHSFIDTAGHPFVPLGVSYYRPNTGWAPQVWKQFDPDATRKDFALLASHGMNTVRVFISLTSFCSEDGSLNPEGIAKFDQFLDLADEANLHVHPTGPDHWEGTPPWSNGDRFSDERLLKIQETFWQHFAARYRGRSTIFAYDLLNEPAVPWQSDAMTAHWNADAEIPDPKSNPPSPRLLDYQHLRESAATTWVARQAKVIHDADPTALVTVGLVQWSFPVIRMPIAQYTGFRATAIAKDLDFIDIHFYPLARGVYKYESPAAEEANLSYLEAVAHEASLTNLPVVLAEFGFYGGGALNAADAPATEDQQAEWCSHAIQTTSHLACGWLNWGMYDHPQAGDVSRLTGLFTADGHEKSWGRAFAGIAKSFRTQPPTYQPPSDRPKLSWDDCITSPDGMDRFSQEYLHAYDAAKSAEQR